MGGADDRPLASDLIEASQQQLPEASGVLDLTEHGLDDLLAQPIAAASPGSFELERHGGDARTAAPSAFAARVVLAVPHAAGSDEGVDA